MDIKRPIAALGEAGWARFQPCHTRSQDWVEFFTENFGIGRVTVANRTHMKWEYIENKLDLVTDSAWLTHV